MGNHTSRSTSSSSYSTAGDASHQSRSRSTSKKLQPPETTISSDEAEQPQPEPLAGTTQSSSTIVSSLLHKSSDIQEQGNQLDSQAVVTENEESRMSTEPTTQTIQFQPGPHDHDLTPSGSGAIRRPRPASFATSASNSSFTHVNGWSGENRLGLARTIPADGGGGNDENLDVTTGMSRTQGMDVESEIGGNRTVTDTKTGRMNRKEKRKSMRGRMMRLLSSSSSSSSSPASPSTSVSASTSPSPASSYEPFSRKGKDRALTTMAEDDAVSSNVPATTMSIATAPEEDQMRSDSKKRRRLSRLWGTGGSETRETSPSNATSSDSHTQIIPVTNMQTMELEQGRTETSASIQDQTPVPAPVPVTASDDDQRMDVDSPILSPTAPLALPLQNFPLDTKNNSTATSTEASLSPVSPPIIPLTTSDPLLDDRLATLSTLRNTLGDDVVRSLPTVQRAGSIGSLRRHVGRLAANMTRGGDGHGDGGAGDGVTESASGSESSAPSNATSGQDLTLTDLPPLPQSTVALLEDLEIETNADEHSQSRDIDLHSLASSGRGEHVTPSQRSGEEDRADSSSRWTDEIPPDVRSRLNPELIATLDRQDEILAQQRRANNGVVHPDRLRNVANRLGGWLGIGSGSQEEFRGDRNDAPYDPSFNNTRTIYPRRQSTPAEATQPATATATASGQNDVDMDSSVGTTAGGLPATEAAAAPSSDPVVPTGTDSATPGETERIPVGAFMIVQGFVQTSMPLGPFTDRSPTTGVTSNQNDTSSARRSRPTTVHGDSFLSDGLDATAVSRALNPLVEIDREDDENSNNIPSTRPAAQRWGDIDPEPEPQPSPAAIHRRRSDGDLNARNDEGSAEDSSSGTNGSFQQEESLTPSFSQQARMLGGLISLATAATASQLLSPSPMGDTAAPAAENDTGTERTPRAHSALETLRNRLRPSSIRNAAHNVEGPTSPGFEVAVREYMRQAMEGEIATTPQSATTALPTDVEASAASSTTPGATAANDNPASEFESFLQTMQADFIRQMEHFATEQHSLTASSSTRSDLGRGGDAGTETASEPPTSTDSGHTTANTDHPTAPTSEEPARNLNFFRMYQFPARRLQPPRPNETEPQQPLIPVVLIGVRSLSREAAREHGDPLDNLPGGAAGTVITDNTDEHAENEANDDNESSISSERPPRVDSDSTGAPMGPNDTRTRWMERLRSWGRLRRNRHRATEATSTNQPIERNDENVRNYLLWIVGGNYPLGHPILTIPNLLTGDLDHDDLWALAQILGQVKPPVATKEDIANSGLEVVKGSQIMTCLEEGKITENCVERCLICLSDYESEESCRIMTCRHVFHADCIDKWLEVGRNSCPACRHAGVKTEKDSPDAQAPTDAFPVPIVPTVTDQQNPQ